MVDYKDWTYNEFSTFAMLYAANIDAHLDQQEEALIRQRLEESKYEAVKSVFEQCSDSECIDTILACHERFMVDEASRQRLLDDFRKVFTADDRYSPVEREMMNIFKKLLH